MLVAVGGVAFDYSRMATMDTELQNAADQAALAAATQLDGKSGTCARAGAAAVNFVTNRTLMANDGGALEVTVTSESACDATGSIKFYQDKAKTTAATTDANADYVEVTVDSRTANFALTPVVARLSSPSLSAKAFAGLGSAICKVPPVMICNPLEASGNLNWDPGANVGKGLRLVSVGNGGGGWAPGNFGYIDTHGGSNGATGLREALGWLSAPGDCIEADGVDTKPGASTSVTDAINTRFDIDNSNPACPNGGNCPPSANSVKDLIRPSDAPSGNNCRIHNQGWVEGSIKYLPSSATTALTTAQMPTVMGHPRDMCHSVDPMTCAQVGDGSWDRNAYFYVNYGSTFDWQAAMNAAGYTASSVTRYQVYQWEMAHPVVTVGGVSKGIGTPRSVDGRYSYGAPICTPSGITPGPATVDRRRISAAIVNCVASGVAGNSTDVTVTKWAELFLVEPSYARDRTGAGDVYVEVIGETAAGGAGTTAGQVVKRDRPYLIE